jgi:hypothetical protein
VHEPISLCDGTELFLIWNMEFMKTKFELVPVCVSMEFHVSNSQDGSFGTSTNILS